MRQLRKITAVILTALLAAASLAVFSACRQSAYSGALKIGSLDAPKNLMPYDSAAGSSTLIAGLIYDTLLGTSIAPAEYTEEEGYTFPDGEVYIPVDLKENPFSFTDNLVKAEGAYAKKEGSNYGYVAYTPTEAQRNIMLQRKNVKKGFTTDNVPITETDAEFLLRAEGIVPSDNWTKYVFEVVDGHTWNDGTPFTAEDIKFSFDYIIRYSAQLGAISTFLGNYSHSVVTEEGKAIELYLATAVKSDIKTICNSILIIPKHIWQGITKPKQEANTANPVGTGAYRLEQFVQDNSVVLKYRQDYNFKSDYFAGEPIDSIMLKKMENIEIQLESLKKGDIDVIYEAIDAAKMQQMKNNPGYGNVKFSSVENEYVTTLLFNVGENGRFGDDKFGGKAKDLRRAVALALDQEGLITDILYGGGSRSSAGLVPSSQSHALFDEEGKYILLQYNVESANAILDAAGFLVGSSGFRNAPDGSKLEIKILTSIGGERLAQALAEKFALIGLKFVYERSDSARLENLKRGRDNFDTYINSVSFSFDKLLMFDARYGVYETDGSPRTWNYAGVNDSELSRLFKEMENAPSFDEQLDKVREVQEAIASKYIELPIFIKNYISAYSEDRFKGWIPLHSSSIFNTYSIRYLQRT